MLDLRQSPQYASYMNSIGWKVLPIKTQSQQAQIFIRSLGIAKLQRPVSLPDWDHLSFLLSRYHVWLCKIEPDFFSLRPDSPVFIPPSQELKQHKFKPDKWPLLPTSTQIIDLTPSLSEIVANFSKKTRYCLEKANRNKFLQINENQFSDFYTLWQISSRLKKLWIPSFKQYDHLIQSFSSQCFCYTVTYNGQTIAGIVVIHFAGKAYYYYSSSLDLGRKLYASYKLLSFAIERAKDSGCSQWDFEGIYDPRYPNASWLGFSHFKKSFGGYTQNHIGSFIRYRLPF